LYRTGPVRGEEQGDTIRPISQAVLQ
jgi:hypothetical protein